MNEIAIGVEALTEQQVLAVARHDARVRLSDEARKAIAASRDILSRIMASPPGSARWPPSRSHRMTARPCSAASSARTRRAPGRRSSARSSAR